MISDQIFELSNLRLLHGRDTQEYTSDQLAREAVVK